MVRAVQVPVGTWAEIKFHCVIDAIDAPDSLFDFYAGGTRISSVAREPTSRWRNGENSMARSAVPVVLSCVEINQYVGFTAVLARRAVRNRHLHAVEQVSRWRGVERVANFDSTQVLKSSKRMIPSRAII